MGQVLKQGWSFCKWDDLCVCSQALKSSTEQTLQPTASILTEVQNLTGKLEFIKAWSKSTGIVKWAEVWILQRKEICFKQ